MYDKEPPNCHECVPELMPENSEVFRVFMKVQNQHIMGFSGPVDLNFDSVKFIMGIQRIPLTRQNEVFEKVYQLYKVTVAAMREKARLEKEEQEQ